MQSSYPSTPLVGPKVIIASGRMSKRDEVMQLRMQYEVKSSQLENVIAYSHCPLSDSVFALLPHTGMSSSWYCFTRKLKVVMFNK